MAESLSKLYPISDPSINANFDEAFKALNRLNETLKTGWKEINQALTYSGGNLAGGDFLANLRPGDKLKLDQPIPITYYWPFDTNSTPTVGANAVMGNVSDPAYETPKFGAGSLSLDGNDALTINDHDDFQLGEDNEAFTLGCWVKRAAVGAVHTIFHSFSDPANANGIRFYIYNTNNKIYFSSGYNAASELEIASASTIDTNWHYLVITYQNNWGKIYVDGVLNGSGYLPTPTYAATNYVRIGCANFTGSNTDFFNGQIDDLFIIKGFAVDEAWVKAQYDADSAQGINNITATQYFQLSNVTDTLLTLISGDYVLYDGSILNAYYSKKEYPAGWPYGIWHIVGANGETKFTNGWVDGASGYIPTSYKRDSNGFVHIRGLIKSGTIGQHAFYLPPGYKPSNYELFPSASNNAYGQVLTYPTGGVLPDIGNNAWLSLCGITFQAGQ